ncbi:MAG: flavodoxin family protein [Chitinivibrionales bacterium]
MKVGILVHSHTGTTLKFAREIESRLKEKGHDVSLVKLETDPAVDPSNISKVKDFKISNLPDATSFDYLLVGGPVWAFSATPVITSCFKQMGSLQGKKVIPFVSMGSPMRFMGGNRAVGMIRKAAEQQGAEVVGNGYVSSKMFHDQPKEMGDIADSIVASIR